MSLSTSAEWKEQNGRPVHILFTRKPAIKETSVNQTRWNL